MADNKAEALKEANSKYQLKVYYDGMSPEDSGVSEAHIEPLDSKHRPWLIKFYTRNGLCHQYANTMGIYRKVSQDMAQVLDAVIVNTKQRAAVDKIIDKILFDYLCTDMANEKDAIEDPCEEIMGDL